MRVTFLGTASAQGYPNAFCNCANCDEARRIGGRSLRKRSAALINDDLLIDLGPDVMTASFIHEVPLTRVAYCLQTHAHDDHLDPSHFLSRSPAYGVPNAPLLRFYASPASADATAVLLERDLPGKGFLTPDGWEELNLEVHQIDALRPFQVGPYRVTAFPASHDRAVESLLFAIERDGCALFYGTDTAELSDETWGAIDACELSFDLMILDHTYGPDTSGSGHLTAWQFIAHVGRMRDMGRLRPTARVLATHISHDANPPHPHLSTFAAAHGYEIAYDGLVVDCYASREPMSLGQGA